MVTVDLQGAFGFAGATGLAPAAGGVDRDCRDFFLVDPVDYFLGIGVLIGIKLMVGAESNGMKAFTRTADIDADDVRHGIAERSGRWRRWFLGRRWGERRVRG